VNAPAARYLSLGAGKQCSTCRLPAIRGKIRSLDAGGLADTGWGPSTVYTRLQRLEDIAVTAGIPIMGVHGGHIRRDALDPQDRLASMPLVAAREVA
jgi:hypothetical protein